VKERREERRDNARARTAERVTQGDRPAVEVDLFVPRLEVAEILEAGQLNAARFICSVPGLLTESKSRPMLRACKPILPIFSADTGSK
jgi:hypothetical protein